MKKKGFTLIELLAVIVILAIIALIAVPMVLNIIEKSKIGALKSSLTGLIESADMYYANNQLQGGNAVETIFDFEDGEQISGATLEYKGKIENGKLILHANGEVAACIDDGTYYAYKNKVANEITNGVGTCLYDGTTGDFSSNSPLDEIQSQIAQATATSSDVLEGKTLFTSSGLVTGTMANKTGSTVTATTVTSDSSYTYATIPTSGYYDTNSKVKIDNSDLTNIKFTQLLKQSSGENLTKTYTFTEDCDFALAIALGAHNNTGANSSISVTSSTAIITTLTDDIIKNSTYISLADEIKFIKNLKAGDTVTLYGTYSAALRLFKIG